MCCSCSCWLLVHDCQLLHRRASASTEVASRDGIDCISIERRRRRGARRQGDTYVAVCGRWTHADTSDECQRQRQQTRHQGHLSSEKRGCSCACRCGLTEMTAGDSYWMGNRIKVRVRGGFFIARGPSSQRVCVARRYAILRARRCCATPPAHRVFSLVRLDGVAARGERGSKQRWMWWCFSALRCVLVKRRTHCAAGVAILLHAAFVPFAW